MSGPYAPLPSTETTGLTYLARAGARVVVRLAVRGLTGSRRLVRRGVVARMGPDGKPVVSCVDSAPAAEAFLTTGSGAGQ